MADKNETAHKFACAIPGCNAELQNEDRERIRREADEHMHANHPEEALEQAKMEGYIQYAGRTQ